jgi:segregation and condensation protein A
MAQDLADWKVRLSVFEGPLDLLLHLIKNQEVDIYDVKLESITQQYLDYLQAMRDLDLEIAGEFLVVAATLLYVKSRTLLPVDQQMPEEETEEADPRWDLIRQLVEYKKFKEAASELENKERLQEKIFHRTTPGAVVVEKEVPTGLGNVTMIDLISAFQKVLDRAREKEGFREVYEDRFTVADKIGYILDTIAKTGQIVFHELFHEMSSRSEIVVTFLALLELIRLKHLKVTQSDTFADITIAQAQTPNGTQVDLGSYPVYISQAPVSEGVMPADQEGGGGGASPDFGDRGAG